VSVPDQPSTERLRAATRAGLAELTGGLAALAEPALAAAVPGGWPVGATLAHLSFFDGWVGERWRRYLATGRFQDLPDDITDLVNAAGARGWAAADPDRARAAALAAAAEVADGSTPCRSGRSPTRSRPAGWRCWTGPCTGGRTLAEIAAAAGSPGAGRTG
jgi:hypothetical protein